MKHYSELSIPLFANENLNTGVSVACKVWNECMEHFKNAVIFMRSSLQRVGRLCITLPLVCCEATKCEISTTLNQLHLHGTKVNEPLIDCTV